MERQKLLIRIAIGVVIAALLIFVVLPFGATLKIYNNAFGRTKTPAPFRFSPEDFPELQVEEHPFTSAKGTPLAGRLYGNPDASPMAIIVLAHDHGTGHAAYLPVIDAFAKQNFLVFAYDVTGTDDSDGKSVRGLPQYLLDLEAALDYLAGDAKLAGHPRLLWGHGAGAYAALNVLAGHRDIAGTVALAGFNSSLEMMRILGHESLGEIADTLLPYFELHEKLRFGKTAESTVVAALNPTDANVPDSAPQGRVMIVQSKDDGEVPLEISYNIFLLNFHNDPRFAFKQFSGRGHDLLFYEPESIAYLNDKAAAFEARFDNGNGTQEKRDAWWEDNVDKELAFNLDTELFEDIVDFYRGALTPTT